MRVVTPRMRTSLLCRYSAGRRLSCLCARSAAKERRKVIRSAEWRLSVPLRPERSEGAAWNFMDEFEFFLEKDWSDGLPVVTPTEARVQRMLTLSRRDPDELVGHIPPMMEPATVRTIAVHAVMAGCKPEYLPVVLGGLQL